MAIRDEELSVFFICDAATIDSPSIKLAERIRRTLIEPAIPERFQNVSLRHGDFHSGPAELDHYTVDMMAQDNLVIVDLTGLDATSYFIVGARAHINLPIVYICEDAWPIPPELRGVNVVPYAMINIEYYIPDLRNAIENALDDYEADLISPRQTSLSDARVELANRIVASAEAIRSLRINSLGVGVDELLSIADDLKKLPDDNSSSRLKEASDKAVKVLFSFMDELSSQAGARITLTGAVSLIVGGGLAFRVPPPSAPAWPSGTERMFSRTGSRESPSADKATV